MLRVVPWVLAIAAVVAAPQLAAGRTHSAQTTCTAAQLRGRVHDSNGAAGTIIVSFTLRNTGAPCTLRGYAGLQLRKGSKALPTKVYHGGAYVARPVRTVSLRTGGAATILVRYGDVPVGNERRCPTSTALAITPPGQTGKLAVHVLIGACGHGSLSESPVVSGIRPAQ